MNALRIPAAPLRILVAALLACAALHGTAIEGTPPTAVAAAAERAAASDVEHPHAAARACFGGLEDGKIVVLKVRLVDGSEQTTVEGCRIGGGVTNRMPRSPTIALGQTVFA